MALAYIFIVIFLLILLRFLIREKYRKEDDFSENTQVKTEPNDNNIISNLSNEEEEQEDDKDEKFTNISTSELNETSLIIIRAYGSNEGDTNILLKGTLSLLNDWDGPVETWDNAIDYYLDDECDFEALEKLNKNNLVKIDGKWSYKNNKGNLYKIHYDFSGLKDDVPEMNIYLFSVSCKLNSMADEALDILYALKVFLPNEKFVLYKRYGMSEDSYLDYAYLSPEQPIEHTYTEIHSLPNEENFDEDAPGHYGEQMEDLAVILKYKDFQKIIKDYNGGMLNF